MRALLVLPLLLAPIGASQDKSQIFVVADTLDLRELMDFWIATKNLNLQFEEGALQGPVKLRTNEGISLETLWAVTNRELVAKGLACVQVPGESNLSVVHLDKAAALARVEVDVAGAEAGYVRALFSLRRVEPSLASAAAKALLPEPEGKVTELQETKQLLLAGLKPQVLQALDLLAVLDGPQEGPVVLEHTLSLATPVAVQTAIEQVLPARAAVAGELKGKVLARPESNSVLIIAPPEEIPELEALINRFDRVQPTVTRHYVPRRFGLAESAKLVEDTVGVRARSRGPEAWRLVQDQLTGTLIITTAPEVHSEVEEVLERLNATPPEARFGLRSIPVKNRPVDELLKMLEGMLEEGSLPAAVDVAVPPEKEPVGTPPNPLPESQPKGGTGGRPEPVRWQEQLTLSADPSVNRILAVGERRLLDEVEALVHELDVHFPQVLIETLVLSLNENQTRDLGVELQSIGTSGDTSVLLASLFGLGSPNPASGVIPPATGTGGVGVVLDPGDFSAVVRSLETLNHGRSLTVPKVLVNNNADANLASVLQTPYTSTNASDTVATTSFGGTLDAGTTIQVRPQIAEGDRLILSYQVSLSSFVGESIDPAVPPPRQENTLQSVVTIPDGHTVVLGGLEVETLTDGVNQVPYLGSVPLLGKLFQSSSKTRTKNRFFVFLRCTVMRSEGFEDLKYVSRTELEEAELDEGWPVLEPLVIR